MGRAERRLAERLNRLNARWDEVSLKRTELDSLQNRIASETSTYSVEALMTCYVLALHNVFGFDKEKSMQALTEVDRLMGLVNSDRLTVEDLKQQCEEQTGIRVVC
jgi:hypothetical protein